MKWLSIFGVLLAVACNAKTAPTALSPEDARKELGKLNITYNEASFINAARDGDRMAVEFFLTAGMDANARDSQGRIAYDFLLQEQKQGVTQADIAFKESRNRLVNNVLSGTSATTALMAATVTGRLEIVRLLLAKGADPNLKDRVDMSALAYAQWLKRDDIVGVLKQTSTQ